jgi:epoxyqueuosine reductase
VPSDSRVPKNPKSVSLTAPSGAAYLDQLRSIAVDAGLDSLGAAPAAEFARARAQIDDRISRDLVNGMKFTFLRPERSTHPERLVEGARSVLVGLLSYAHEDPLGIEQSGPPRARIARYAWRDHYADLKSSLTQVAARLRLDGHRATVFADDNSIVDREAAWLAGLGWFGKNANLLVPGKGSMFVIGCVVTTAEFPVVVPEADACGACSRCIPACPTGAIVEPGVIDAHSCLSWLLQKPGVRARRFVAGDACRRARVPCARRQRARHGLRPLVRARPRHDMGAAQSSRRARQHR